MCVIKFFGLTKRITFSVRQKDLKEALKTSVKLNDVVEPILYGEFDYEKLFYYDKEDVFGLIKGELLLSEYKERWFCDGLFRNIMPIEVPNEEQINIGNLWMQRNKQMILVDKDRYFASDVLGIPITFDYLFETV